MGNRTTEEASNQEGKNQRKTKVTLEPKIDTEEKCEAAQRTTMVRITL